MGQTFWARLKELTFALAGKLWEHMDARDILRFIRLETSNAPLNKTDPFLREMIHCLYSNVVHCLLVATSLSRIDYKEQTAFRYKIYGSLITDPNVH